MDLDSVILLVIMKLCDCNGLFALSTSDDNYPMMNSALPSGSYASYSRYSPLSTRHLAGNNIAVTSFSYNDDDDSCPDRCTGCPTSCFKPEPNTSYEVYDVLYPGLFQSPAKLDQIDMKTFGRKLSKKTGLKSNFTIFKKQAPIYKQKNSVVFSKRRERDAEDDNDAVSNRGTVGSDSSLLVDGDICCPAELTRFQPMEPIKDINGEMYLVVQLDRVNKYQSVTVSECKFNGIMEYCPGQCVTTMGVFTLLAFCKPENSCRNKVDSSVSFEQFELPTGCICKNFNG
ncbi:uncharacterized protein LOC106168987 isoform X2 [Lingula anatina]|uniref:Uncharacterized protein LOC106168987 isoform X2 n=1 Tax=Lingula anatina TaxID=7574 RepID=A0A1S3IZU8_LINAN|nr:uncharacterized protein LOC106168987 isoform X2 [Lingula anatina]|eukprot:XP_013403720.1 uncharacterized protein LOC106168987 isoform X2 [Lingula anatina]